MSKQQLNLTIETNLVKRFKEQIDSGKRSNLIEQFISDLLDGNNKDADSINIKIVKQKKSKVVDEITQLQGKLAKYNKLIMVYENNQKNKRLQQLEEEREKAMSDDLKGRCFACDVRFSLQNQSHLPLSNGRSVCKKCFTLCDNEGVHRWKSLAKAQSNI